MPCQDNEDVYFMQGRDELSRAEYVIPDGFADPLSFPKELLERAGPPSNYEIMSLHASIVWVRSTCPAKDALKAVLTGTHLDPNSTLKFQNATERSARKKFLRRSSMRILPAGHMNNPEKIKYVCFRALLGMWVGWIAAAMHLEHPYV